MLIVGVADDGTLIGTELDAQLLRRRIYDLTDRLLTVDVTPVTCRGVRLLLVRSPEAVHPVMFDHKYHHRVADSCVEVDATSWEERRRRHAGWDWSAQDSGVAVDAARSTALQRARDFLTAAGEDRNLDLAAAPVGDLLRRLNVVTPSGTLTNAGVIAFVGRGAPAIDYVRREVTGGDSVQRIRDAGRGLLEELYEVDRAIEASNPVRHLPRGSSAGRSVRSRRVRPAKPSSTVSPTGTGPVPTPSTSSTSVPDWWSPHPEVSSAESPPATSSPTPRNRGTGRWRTCWRACASRNSKASVSTGWSVTWFVWGIPHPPSRRSPDPWSAPSSWVPAWTRGGWRSSTTWNRPGPRTTSTPSSSSGTSSTTGGSTRASRPPHPAVRCRGGRRPAPVGRRPGG